MAAAAFQPFENQSVTFVILLGALAAATADTWATEIGAFSPRNPRHILSFQEVTKGSSGGVTLLGTL